MLCTLVGFCTYAQESNGKYIQIKEVYNFQERFNEYRVNSYLKHKFEEAGYMVFYDNQPVPDAVKADPCKLYICNVERDKATLTTKLKVTLVNCKDETVFTANGQSRIKRRVHSHVDALKNALEFSTLKK